jgi:hypothetical protein
MGLCSQQQALTQDACFRTDQVCLRALDTLAPTRLALIMC